MDRALLPFVDGNDQLADDDNACECSTECNGNPLFYGIMIAVGGQGGPGTLEYMRVTDISRELVFRWHEGLRSMVC